MGVRVKPPRELHAWVEPPLLVPLEARFPVLEVCVEELDVALSEDVLDDLLVLLDADGAGGVDHNSAGFGLGVEGVDAGEEELR